MQQTFRLPRKSTIVRFLIPLVAALSSACTGLPPRAAVDADCPPASLRICEDFGPESRCECADLRALDRTLGRLGLDARRPTTAW